MVIQMPNSQTSLKIVMAFLQFLNIVHLSSPEEQECMHTVTVCLRKLFRIPDSYEPDASTGPFMEMLNFGEMKDGVEIMEPKSSAGAPSGAADAPSSSNSASFARSENCTGSELFELFNLTLPKNAFFLPHENSRLHASIFLDAIEYLTAASKAFNLHNLAEAMQMLGHKAMVKMDYHGAAVLYTYAITIWENNAAFYCNRAFALLHMKYYQEAISDCVRAFQINPRCVEIFNALGLIYYDKENYVDAICKGFAKALQLDPHNEIAQQNMELSAQRLKAKLDEYERESFNLQVLLSVMAENIEDVGVGGRGRRQQNRGRGQGRQQNNRRTRARNNNSIVAHDVEDVEMMLEGHEQNELQNVLYNGGAAAPNGAANNGRNDMEGYAPF